MLAMLIDVYSLVVLVAVVVSWLRLSQDNPAVRVSQTLTEPALGPIRKVLPSFAGLDLSPIVLLLGLRFLRSLV
jgi:YggT family protein